MVDSPFTSPLTDAARGDDGSPRALFTVSPPYVERTLSRREALLAQAAQAAPGGRRSAALLALAGADVQATARVPSAAEQVQSDVQPHHVPPSPLWVAATPGYSSDSDSSSIAVGGSPEARPASGAAEAEAAEDAIAVERLTATVMSLADGRTSARHPAWHALPAEHGEGVDDSAEEVAAAEAAVADAADALGCAIVALRAAVGARCLRLEARASDAEREARGASFDAARKIAAEQHRNAALRLENATLAAELEAVKQELAAARRRTSLAATPLPPRTSASAAGLHRSYTAGDAAPPAAGLRTEHETLLQKLRRLSSADARPRAGFGESRRLSAEEAAPSPALATAPGPPSPT